MTINTLYVPLFNIEEVILDKDTGLPLSGGIVTFYRDSQRTTPKDVFQISGSSPDYTFVDVGAVFTLGISGTFVDTNGDPFVPYAFPYDAAGEVDYYYVTVVSAGGVPQFTRESVPYIPSSNIPPEDRENTENELSNSQFVEVNFPSGSNPTTIAVSGTNTVTSIAPDWDIITTGTDNLVVQRLEPIASNVPTNPPYALSIQAGSGFGSTITLRQRLYNSPSLLRGQFISGNLTAAVLGGGGSALNMVYAPSTGTATTIIPSTNVSTDGAYHTIVGNAAIPQQANDPASVGYVDILITIPTSRTIAITSLQIVGVAEAVDIPFDQQSSGRQKDHLFHYYENAAVHQAKGNILTGWTFGLNPWQFTTTVSTNLANNAYTADQTIVIQQNYVNSAVGNNIAVGRGTAAQNYGFNVTAVTATNKFILLQYIDPRTIRPYWGQKLSVKVKASAILGAGHTTTPQFKVRLIYLNTLPSPTAQAVPVSSWTNVDGSIPGLAGWTYITPVNDPTYTLTSTEQDFDFNGFVLPASSSDTMTLGIMVIMMNNLNSSATADQLLFDRISLVNSDFAVDATPETWDETLRKCQYYYEKSYDVGSLAGTVTNNGSLTKLMTTTLSTASGACYPAPFQWSFNTIKRVAPTVTIYDSATGAANLVHVESYRNGALNNTADVTIGFWTASGGGTKGIDYVVTSPGAIVTATAAADNLSCIIRYHFVADARLG